MPDKKWFSFRRNRSDTTEAEKAPQLRPANENPWYCLATLHGEQPMDGNWDQELAEKNRVAWDRWIGADGANRNELADIFARRTSKSLTLPEPKTPADFSHTRFDRPLNLAGFRFVWPADFRSAVFVGETSFQNAVFNSKADFSSATFSRETNFGGVHLDAGADFQSVTFARSVHFQRAYLTNINFRSATFSGAANFHDTNFHGNDLAIFYRATFSGEATFVGAKFPSGAGFDGVTFSMSTSFDGAKFKEVSFKTATFSGHIQFVDATFDGPANFAFARFEAQPPDLRGAEMHEATAWHGVIWPRPAMNEDAQQQVYAYERLKQEMERLKKHEDEQHVFRMELRARRGLLRIFSGEWLLNLAYQCLSNYGISY